MRKDLISTIVIFALLATGLIFGMSNMRQTALAAINCNTTDSTTICSGGIGEGGPEVGSGDGLGHHSTLSGDILTFNGGGTATIGLGLGDGSGGQVACIDRDCTTIHGGASPKR